MIDVGRTLLASCPVLTFIVRTKILLNTSCATIPSDCSCGGNNFHCPTLKLGAVLCNVVNEFTRRLSAIATCGECVTL